MPATYYIDGYNVIHFSSVLKPLAMRDFESARDALIEKVAAFCAFTRCPTIIVFDGRGRRSAATAPRSDVPGLKVLYSHGDKTADAMIERIVYEAKERRDIIVVTGDRGIRGFCQSLGALVMEPDHFLANVREHAATTRAAMDFIKRPDTLNRIEGRLGNETLDKLEALKRRLEGGK